MTLRGAAAPLHRQAGSGGWRCNRDSLPWISFSYSHPLIRALGKFMPGPNHTQQEVKLKILVLLRACEADCGR